MNEYEFVSSELLRYEELSQKERDLIYALLMGQIRLEEIDEKLRSRAVCEVAVQMHPNALKAVPEIYKEEISNHITEYSLYSQMRDELIVERDEEAEQIQKKEEKQEKEKEKGLDRILP